jgi:CO/xanthine dehydrogenase Mo-binding subunit
MSLIGQSVKRLEDHPLLCGSGRFAADVAVTDMLYSRR